MKIFHCYFHWSGAFGCYQEHHAIAVATSASEALGLAITEYPNTDRADWLIYEIQTIESSIERISERGT